MNARTRRFALLFVAGVLCLQAIFFASLAPRIARGYPDFTVFYTAARILGDGLGHQLYVASVQDRVQKEFTGELPSRPAALPYIHPPFEALFFVPLSHLPYREAFLLWDLINIAILFSVAALLRPMLSLLQPIPAWKFVLADIAFFPVFECLLQGQDSILQLLFVVLAWRAMQRNGDLLAGCWLALGAFKFQLILPLLLLIWIWKRRDVLVGFAVVTAALAGISLVLVGWEGLGQYPAFAMRIANTPGLGGVPADFLPNLHGLIMGSPLRMTGKLGVALVVLSSVGLFLFVAVKMWRAGEKFDLRFSAAVAVAELVGWQTNIHDYSLLLLPLLLVTEHCVRMPAVPTGSRWALLYSVLPLLISPVWFLLWLFIGNVNLVAIPMLWWIWKLSQESSG